MGERVPTYEMKGAVVDDDGNVYVEFYRMIGVGTVRIDARRFQKMAEDYLLDIHHDHHQQKGR